MSDYSETLAATDGRNLGKLHEEIKTWQERYDTAQKRAEGYQRDAEETREKAVTQWAENRKLREQLADVQAVLNESRRGQAEAEHRARALEYALQPFAALEMDSHVAGALLPVEWQSVCEARALIGRIGEGPRMIARLVAIATENAFSRNDHKPDWHGDPIFDRFAKVIEEYEETRHEAGKAARGEENRDRLAAECEDLIASTAIVLDWAHGWNTINRGREVTHGA